MGSGRGSRASTATGHRQPTTGCHRDRAGHRLSAGWPLVVHAWWFDRWAHLVRSGEALCGLP